MYRNLLKLRWHVARAGRNGLPATLAACILAGYLLPCAAGQLPNDIRLSSIPMYESTIVGIGATFVHAGTMVNGTRLHYVTVGNRLHKRLWNSSTQNCDAGASSACPEGATRSSEDTLVVLLHDWPQSWYAWRHILPRLAVEHYVIAPDLRGSCDSGKTPSGYEKSNLALDVRNLAHRLGFNKVKLVGHGVGAMVAYAYAAKFPKEVTRVVLLDSDLPGTKSWGAPSLRTGAPLVTVEKELKALQDPVDGQEREYITSTIHAAALHAEAISPADITEYTRCLKSPGVRRSGVEYFNAFVLDEQENQEFMKTQLRMPVLALASALPGRDQVLDGLRMVATDMQARTLPRSGHWAPEEAPEVLFGELRTFLADR